MTLRGQLRSRPSSPSTHQPKRACILRLQLLAGGSSGAGFLMHFVARHHHLSSCIANNFFNALQTLPHTKLDGPSLVNSSAPDFLASNTSKENETLCSNLMPVIPSRRSVCAQQASRAKLGAERGATPNLISPSRMASCFYQLCTSICSQQHVTAKDCTYIVYTAVRRYEKEATPLHAATSMARIPDAASMQDNQNAGSQFGNSRACTTLNDSARSRAIIKTEVVQVQMASTAEQDKSRDRTIAAPSYLQGGTTYMTFV
jgi:hypothetical protein